MVRWFARLSPAQRLEWRSTRTHSEPPEGSLALRLAFQETPYDRFAVFIVSAILVPREGPLEFVEHERLPDEILTLFAEIASCPDAGQRAAAVARSSSRPGRR